MSSVEILGKLARIMNHKLDRGLVWCIHCGRIEHVDSSECLRHGWPKCCGQTMTIDWPAEREALSFGNSQSAIGNSPGGDEPAEA